MAGLGKQNIGSIPRLRSQRTVTACLYMLLTLFGLSTASGARAAPQLDINKTSDVAGFVTPGETITYTINVSNTGTGPLSGVSVTDILPAGTAYVAGSTQVNAPGASSNETVRDEFNSVSFNNNNGSVAWATNWIEIDGDGAGPATGNARITGGELSDRKSTRLNSSH